MSGARIARFILALLLATAVTSSCGAKKSSPSALESKQASVVFNQSRVAACVQHLLLAHESLRGRELADPMTRFTGLSGYILVSASPSSVDPGAKARIDTVQMFFFDTPREAQRAQTRLARFYVYFHGPLSYVRVLRPVPPDAAALRSIERIAGNVDVFWQYPRHHPVESDRTLNRCLASSRA